MAQAVKRLYPGQLAIRPAIDSGFYYDFDYERSFTPEDMQAIEEEMRRIIKEDLGVERFTLPRDEALELVKDEPYKVELINELPEDSEISFYKQGEFTDLCAGPHLPSTGKVKAFMQLAGAYWRGSEKNKMPRGFMVRLFRRRAIWMSTCAEEAKTRHPSLGRARSL